MDCQEMDLIESRSERSNFGILLLFDNFLENGLITFSLFFFCKQLLVDNIDQLEFDLIELFKRSFKGRKGQVWPIFP